MGQRFSPVSSRCPNLYRICNFDHMAAIPCQYNKALYWHGMVTSWQDDEEEDTMMSMIGTLKAGCASVKEYAGLYLPIQY